MHERLVIGTEARLTVQFHADGGPMATVFPANTGVGERIVLLVLIAGIVLLVVLLLVFGLGLAVWIAAYQG
ncbi:MAG: hypothetical protein ABMA13_11795 [Chthoniobacteraceae bacterium]